MESPKKVIGRPSKYQKLVNGLALYLTEARADPSLPLTILAISRSIGVKKSTIYLYQHEPEVAELLDNIRALAKARKIAAYDIDEISDVEVGGSDELSTGAGPDVVAVATQPVCLDVLALRSAGAVQGAVWSMSRFVGRHRKHRHVSDLPRIVYDLDVMLAELHRSREELHGMSNEWKQHSQNDRDLAGEEGQLSLTDIYKE